MLRILLVEDDPIHNYVTLSLLDKCGADLELSVSTDGEKAWKKLQNMNRLPDVLLLDLHMPGCDGFELLSRLRHNPIKGSPDMKVVVLTLTNDAQEVERAKRLGATGVLMKPLDLDELRKILA